MLLRRHDSIGVIDLCSYMLLDMPIYVCHSTDIEGKITYVLKDFPLQMLQEKTRLHTVAVLKHFPLQIL